MLPELFKIPFVGTPVWAYGLMLATALTAGLLAALYLAGQDGLPKKKIYHLGLCIIPIALLGGKLAGIFADTPGPAGGWQRTDSLDPSTGSGTYLGGFVMGVAASLVMARLWKLPWPGVADAFAPGIALGYAIARIGCFMAGCCWGKPTSSWIGVRFTERAHLLTAVPTDSALLPTQLIEASGSILIFSLLLWLRKRRLFQGQIILAYTALYSIGRFTIEFWRDDPRGRMLGLSISQLISAVLFPLALAFYLCLLLKRSPGFGVGRHGAVVPLIAAFRGRLEGRSRGGTLEAWPPGGRRRSTLEACAPRAGNVQSPEGKLEAGPTSAREKLYE